MTKKIFLTIASFLIVSLSLISATCISGAASLPFGKSTATVALSTPAPTQTTDQEMNDIESQVSLFRGLTMESPLTRDLMSSADLREKVVNDFFVDYTAEDAAKDALELSALGLLDKNFNLLTFYQDLYAEQIAGYYDNETKEMYVISDASFGGIEKMTYSHEYTHALQDATWDFETVLNYNDDTCELDTEYCAAVSALLEGDATLSEYTWYSRYATDADQQDISDFYQSYTSPVYDSAPEYMKQDFLFPYDKGYEFVNTLYEKGRWNAVNAAYENPPVDTEQILHPEKYPDELPIKVDVPDMLTILGDDWEEYDRNVMGEWYTYLILAYGRDSAFRLDEETAKTASAGWGGDTYVFYDNPDNGATALVWVSQWDTSTDADEFAQAILTYGTARWGVPTTAANGANTWTSTTDGYVYIHQVGDKIVWIMAPTRDQQHAILNALSGSL